jgi:hypothetical protein
LEFIFIEYQPQCQKISSPEDKRKQCGGDRYYANIRHKNVASINNYSTLRGERHKKIPVYKGGEANTNPLDFT